MNLMNSRTKLLAALVCAGALAGCNAVETVNEPPAIANPLAKVLLEGVVSGLSESRPVELSVQTTNNGVVASQIVPTRGSTLLRLGSADQGAAYQVTVFKNPFGRTCTVANGSGTANADVSNIHRDLRSRRCPAVYLDRGNCRGAVQRSACGIQGDPDHRGGYRNHRSCRRTNHGDICTPTAVSAQHHSPRLHLYGYGHTIRLVARRTAVRWHLLRQRCS